MTSQVVRSLEVKRLIDREVDPSDTRARRLEVTRRGARLAPRAIAVVERADAEFFGEVDALDVLRSLAAFSAPGRARGRGTLRPS